MVVTLSRTVEDQELMWLDPKTLKVDATYQRALNPAHVQKLVDNWDDRACGVIYVADRGALFVIDGQHRVEAAKQVGVSEIPCLVYRGLTKASQAGLFATYNRVRHQIQQADIFRARLVQGDRNAEHLNAMITGLGWKIGPLSRGGYFSAVGAAERIYNLLGDRPLHAILAIMRRVWGDTGNNAQVMKALAALFSHYGPKAFDWDAMERALNGVDIRAIVSDAQSRRKVSVVALGAVPATAIVIADLYNRTQPRRSRWAIPSASRFTTALRHYRWEEE